MTRVVRTLSALALLLAFATAAFTPGGTAMAATQQIRVASFNNGAAQLFLRFDDGNRQIDAAICNVTQGVLIVTLERKNGQVRTFTCTTGSTTISGTNIPGSLQMEWDDDPEFGGWTMTSPNGNVILRAEYDPTDG
jgi:hypothetical protein